MSSTSVKGRAAIVGAGLMGAQIGAEYGLAGYEVKLCCRSEGAANEAMERARVALDRLSELGAASRGDTASASGRLSPVTSVKDACRGSEIVIESVVEDLSLKVAVLHEIRDAAPDAIVASNTSSLSITKLGEASGLGSRFLGTHYWNPPTLMPLVEVVTGAATALKVAEEMVSLLHRLGKEPVLVPDIPGFVWNRLQFALLREALRLVQDYSVKPDTIDLIVKKGLGRRWSLVGPFETAALGGVKTFAAVAAELFPELEVGGVDPRTLLQVAQATKERQQALVTQRDAELGRRLVQDMREGVSS